MQEIHETENIVTSNIQKYDPSNEALDPEQVARQIEVVNKIYSKIMIKDQHYGVIAGTTSKPTLLKAGAEKLCFTFRLRPEFEVIEINEDNTEHREFRVSCKLYSMASGLQVGQGVGSCTTKETKYRYRKGEPIETGIPVPQMYWDLIKQKNPNEAQALIGKDKTVNKIKGRWEVVIKGDKVEFDNPADYYNTVLKMAKKRAFVDATITATASSDIFVQDVEDMPFINKVVSKIVEPVKVASKIVEPVKEQAKIVEPVKVASKIVEPVKEQAKIDNTLESALQLIRQDAKWNKKSYSGGTAFYISGAKFKFQTDSEYNKACEVYDEIHKVEDYLAESNVIDLPI